MKLAEKPKTYLLKVEYKGFWPSFVIICYHYANIESVSAHVAWLMGKMARQNGKRGVRENVICSFSLDEYIRSKKRIKEFPLLEQFSPPSGRKKPEGGINQLGEE